MRKLFVFLCCFILTSCDSAEESVQVNSNALYVDSKIGVALKDGCENKILLLAVEPKFVFPDDHDSEFCFRGYDNNILISCDGKSVSVEQFESINQQQQEQLKADILTARKGGLEQFVKLNPELVGADKQKDYLESLYGALEIKLDACGWQAFIDKNHDILDAVALRCLVNNESFHACQKTIKYNVLLNTNEYHDKTKLTPSWKMISTTDELASYSSLGMDAKLIHSIDFSKDIVIYLSGGEKPTDAYSLQIGDICVDKIDVRIVQCAGWNEGEMLSDPRMLIQLPKNKYDVEFRESESVCE